MITDDPPPWAWPLKPPVDALHPLLHPLPPPAAVPPSGQNSDPQMWLQMFTKSIFLTHPPKKNNPRPAPTLPLCSQTPQPCDRKEEEEERPKEAPGKPVLTPDPPRPRQTCSQPPFGSALPSSLYRAPLIGGWQRHLQPQCQNPTHTPKRKPAPSPLPASPHFLGLLWAGDRTPPLAGLPYNYSHPRKEEGGVGAPPQNDS